MRNWKRIALNLAAGACLVACSTYDPEVTPSPLRNLTASQRSDLDKAEAGNPRLLHALFRKSLDTKLDGEAAELYSAELWEVLQKMGPDRFWDMLQKETPHVRKSVEFYLDPLLRNNPEYNDLYRKLVPPEERHDAQYYSTHPWQ